MKYELNNAYQADSFKAIKEIPDKSVDCIYVDVPYLYDNGGSGNSELSKRIDKVDKTLDKLNIVSGFNYAIYDDFLRIMKKCNIFIWCSKMQIVDTLNYFVSKGYNYEILVWTKTNPIPATNNTWLSDIEYCLYFREKGVKLNDGIQLKSKYYNSPINQTDKKFFDHPTIKPLDLVKRHLLHATQPDDIVVDFFLGSGTTCVAAKEIGRRFLGFEIDEKYAKISQNRLNGITKNGQQGFMFDDNGNLL